MQMLIVTCTSREGEIHEVTLNVADIACVKPRNDNTGGTIIDRLSTPFAVWALEEYSEVMNRLRATEVEFV